MCLYLGILIERKYLFKRKMGNNIKAINPILPADLKLDIEKIQSRKVYFPAVELKRRPFFVRERVLKRLSELDTTSLKKIPVSARGGVKDGLGDWVNKWYVLKRKGELTGTDRNEYIRYKNHLAKYGPGYIPTAPPVTQLCPLPTTHYYNPDLKDWVVHQYILSKQRVKKNILS